MDFQRPLSVVAPSLDGDVLGVLAGAEEEFTGRRIHQVLGHGSEQGIRKAADRLVEQGIVTRRQAGQAKLYSLNRSHLAAPYVEELGGLRAELVKRLKKLVADWEIEPLALFVFGSVATGEAGADSDLDIFVLRPTGTQPSDPIWSEQLDNLETEATVWTGNEARLVQYRRRDLTEVAVRNLVRQVIREGIPIVGTRPELRAIIRKYKP